MDKCTWENDIEIRKFVAVTDQICCLVKICIFLFLFCNDWYESKSAFHLANYAAISLYISIKFAVPA